MKLKVNAMAIATILMVGGAAQVSVGAQYDIPNWVSEEVVSASLEFGKKGKNRETDIKDYVNLKRGDEIASVIIVGSSKRGNGQVELWEGQELIQVKDLHSSLTSVQITVNSSFRHKTPLLIKTSGNIYLHSVSVVLADGDPTSQRESRAEEERRIRAEELAKAEADKRLLEEAQRERKRRKRRRDRERREARQCVGNNVYGFWARGGGCNAYGCYWSGGGCNAYGCYESGGSCNAYGCIKPAPKSKRACD